MIKTPNYHFQSIYILNVRVDLITCEELKKYLLYLLTNRIKGWFSYINIHTIEFALENPWYKEFIEKALISYCDGDGVRLGAKLLNQKVPEKITLSDFIYDVAELSQQRNFRLYLLGANKETIIIAEKNLKIIFPNINICGYHHGFFNDIENEKIINDINLKAPDILIIGMGVPRQELWVKNNIEKLNVTIAWVGGGIFELVSGAKKRSPDWLSGIGFEWLFRLIQEPKRLWKRYLIGNPLFFIRIIKYKIRVIFCSAERQKANAAK